MSRSHSAELISDACFFLMNKPCENAGVEMTSKYTALRLPSVLVRKLIDWYFSRLSILLFACAFSVAAMAEAGVVAFALGESSVERGQTIFVGDVIETGDNGHVHIRFVDGALVSVRPNSELRVDEYTYVPEDPEQNRVRFTLKSGTVRSVTGEAGKANKDAYRMNTPVSAIGIRGTDYTVFSDDQRTRVEVQSGGIGIAPLDDECSADDVGVCASSKLVELFAGESYVIEISALSQSDLSPASQNTLQTPRIAVATEFELSSLKLDATVEVSRLTDLTDVQVSWAHWTNLEDVLGLQFKPIKPYLNSKWRIVSANSLFGLFMRPDTPSVPRTGQIDYDLTRYEAYFINASQIEQAALFDAALSIDFSSREFDFSGRLSSQSATDRINLSGRLSDDGFLRSRTDSVTVNGGIISNGLGAGLLFETGQNDATRFVGASTWSKN